MKTRVAEEAEESTTMINGSKGIIARCVAHLGDYNLLKDDTYKRRYNILVKNYYDVLGSEKVEQDHESEEDILRKNGAK